MNISQARDHNILFLASEIFLSSQPEIIIFIQLYTNTNIAKATILISKKVIIAPKVAQK
jgi:hypothetical protein